jgi:hypothetical protein
MVDYKFYNANPLGKIEQDCVCRAISRATRIPYKVIENKLNQVGNLFECEALCVCCYQFLLQDVFGLKQRVSNGDSVKELAEKFKSNIILIRIQGHLTMAEYGVVYDLWDCREEVADVFWIVS